MGTTKRSFTLIELLTVIAIISILIGVLVPSMSRSLSGNRLASDVEVLRAKIEETRLLAGSTQTADEQSGVEIEGKDRVGYYGILIPGGSTYLSDPSNQYYAIVRLSNPVTQTREDPEYDGYCSGLNAVNDANVGSGSCLVERVNLTKGVKFNKADPYNLDFKVLAFRVPSQQLTEIYCPHSCSRYDPNHNFTIVPEPLFNQYVDGVYLQLTHNNKKATIKVESYTGKLIVEYGTI
ncbi:MAG: prepilin-type N-terminal cleavage/methylation domain-containing protein [Candidatus Berkelbacteria bacterium]|nr:prepilin-type N-terminal cleavage/methylation domain-containing protein [Candidatus Berkelbacteria bacterium]